MRSIGRKDRNFPSCSAERRLPLGGSGSGGEKPVIDAKISPFPRRFGVGRRCTLAGSEPDAKKHVR